MAKKLAHRKQIEQRLCRMLVVAVPGVEQWDVHLLGQLLQHAVRLQTDHPGVDAIDSSVRTVS